MILKFFEFNAIFYLYNFISIDLSFFVATIAQILQILIERNDYSHNEKGLCQLCHCWRSIVSPFSSIMNKVGLFEIQCDWSVDILAFIDVIRAFGGVLN